MKFEQKHILTIVLFNICFSASGQSDEVYIAQQFDFLPVFLVAILSFAGGVGLAYLILYKRFSKKMLSMKVNVEDSKPEQKPQKFDNVTVLFSDIEGFTKITESTNQEVLVDKLEKYFVYFDELVDMWNVEKIKTIGDAYMCAGGVPHHDCANPIEVTLVGLGMIGYVKEQQQTNGDFWNMRVGINTGPVISAHLGHKKKTFDIWGDSVNTASRMESSGSPGEVNISVDTYYKICDYFEFEHRGKMPVKYKGNIDMYFVKRLKPEYCVPGSTFMANQHLKTKMLGMKINDILEDYEEQLQADGEKAEPFVERFEQLWCDLEMLGRLEKFDDREFMFAKLGLLLSFAHSEGPTQIKVDMPTLAKRLRDINMQETDIEKVTKMSVRLMHERTLETKIEEILLDTFNMMFIKKDFAQRATLHYRCSRSSGRIGSKSEWIKHIRKQTDNLKLRTEAAKSVQEVGLTGQIEVFEQIFR